ncbi:Domain of unknown function DUF262 [Candidatus Nanopelagicaceae bacterium]
MSVEGTVAPILSLKDYLTGKNQIQSDPLKPTPSRLLVVPPWQREYVWTPSESGEVGILLEDLRDFVLGKDDDYLMGSILLSKGTKEDHERLLIDGQQRTLTYSILLMCILKHAQNAHATVLKNHDVEQQRTLVDMRTSVSNDDAMYIPRVSMPHSKANDMLQSIFAWSKVADGEASDLFTEEKDHWTQTQRNLIDVATWIYEKKLKTENWLPNPDLLTHMRKILDGVKFLQITLSSQQEAIAIFDRINSRGALLDSGDLIKNRIFQTVESDEDFNVISRSWMQMNESLAQCSLKRMREPKFLLRAMALSDQALKDHMEEESDQPDTKFTAPKITYEKLTTYWGERLDPKASHSHSVKKVSPFDFADDLVNASQWLHALSKEQTVKMKSLTELYFSRYLNSVQHYPMLLAGRNFNDFEVLAHLTRQVHNRTAFYLLSEERTQDFESLVPTWTGLITKLGSKATKSQLDDIYLNDVQVSVEAIDALVEQMRNWSYKSSDKKKIRAVLSQLTRVVDIAGGKEDKESPASYFSTKKDENKESWDIEHVQPSKGAAKDSEVHKIGNLVLLKADHNSLKRAESPQKKSDVYRGSHLLLTQSLVGITIDKERKKVEEFFKAAKFAGTGWDVSDWGSSSMKSREDLYAALLKYHLTTLD